MSQLANLKTCRYYIKDPDNNPSDLDLHCSKFYFYFSQLDKVLLTVPRRYFFCGSFVCVCVFLSCVSQVLRLCIDALWSPAGKVLTSWLLLVMFIVFLLLSHVVS